jgi:8-oxo-dGTP pyrophosphatase MutT (NUDIX family)
MRRYTDFHPDEADRLAPLLAQLSSGAEMTDRRALPGHVTASGIVIENGRMLLIFHPFLQRWLQPGGHVDAGEAPLPAAQREVLEETGLRSIAHDWHATQAMPFDIDIHRIPSNPKKNEAAHLHYDFRYLLRADTANPERPLETDHPIQWRPLAEMATSNLRRVIEKLTARRLS